MRVWLYIAMIEGTAIVHVNFVVIFQVIHQIWDVTSNCAFRSSIWTTIRSILALRLMLQLAVVRINAWAPKALVLAWKFKRCSHLLKSKTPYVTQFMPTSWTTVMNPWFASGTQCMTIRALMNRRIHGTQTDWTFQKFTHTARHHNIRFWWVLSMVTREFSNIQHLSLRGINNLRTGIIDISSCGHHQGLGIIWSSRNGQATHR